MKILLVTFSDNADHQDTLFGLYEELIGNKDIDAYLLCYKESKSIAKNIRPHMACGLPQETWH